MHEVSEEMAPMVYGVVWFLLHQKKPLKARYTVEDICLFLEDNKLDKELKRKQETLDAKTTSSSKETQKELRCHVMKALQCIKRKERNYGVVMYQRIQHERIMGIIKKPQFF